MLERGNMEVHKHGKYVSGKWRENSLAVVKTGNNLLVVVKIENNFWSKLEIKVKIRSKTFQCNIL